MSILQNLFNIRTVNIKLGYNYKKYVENELYKSNYFTIKMYFQSKPQNTHSMPFRQFECTSEI